MTPRHFLTLKDLSKKEFKKILERAAELKQAQHKGVIYQPFIGKVMAMIFEKSSHFFSPLTIRNLAAANP